MPITNPATITPGACGVMWITSVNLLPTRLMAVLRPTDGTFVIGNESKARRINIDITTDAAARSQVEIIFALVQQLAGKTAAVTNVAFTSTDPAVPIIVLCSFADRTFYKIPDLLSLISSNPAAAAVYGPFLTYLAGK